MRLAFVVQRYGLEVNGGAELHCRQVVERLASTYDIEVLTTCAQEYTTWENAYPQGVDQVNGILVHRFPTLQPREAKFGERSAWIFSHPHSLQDELEWLYAQGPLAPDLLQYIAAHRFDYDAFIFFTYIYYPTTLGLRLAADRALLVSTSHDEPPIYLDMYKALFHSPRAILYNSFEEKEFIEDLFDVAHIRNDVVGLGVDVPQETNPAAFCGQYNIAVPYILYVGRVSPSKNCQVLIDDFIRYKAAHPGSLKLVLIGQVEITIPEHPDIVSLGFVSDEDKFNAMAGAEILVLPSKYESLSMVFLESMALETPVLCDGTSAVLRGHCLRSNGGLYYLNPPEFETSLEVLLSNPRLRQVMGQNGKNYVRKNYVWDKVLQKYHRLLAQTVQNRWWSV